MKSGCAHGPLTPGRIERNGRASLRHVYTLLATFSLLISGRQALATDGSWISNASLNWSAPTNWSAGQVADGSGATAWFTNNISLARTVTIDTTNRSLGVLNIGDADGSHAFTIAASGGARLTFTNNGANAQLNQVAASRGDTLSTPVVLADSLDIANASANLLTLSGGITNVTAGTRTLSHAGTGSGGSTISGAIGPNVSVVQNSASGPLTLSGANTFTNGLLIRSGTVKATVALALGAGATPITLGDAGGSAEVTLSAAGGGGLTFVNPIVVASNHTGLASITDSSANTFSGPVTLYSHDLTLAAPAARLTVSGGITGTGTLTITNAGAGYVQLTSLAVNHNGSVVNTGSGTNDTTLGGGIGPNVTAITQKSASSSLLLVTSNLTVNPAGTTLANHAAGGPALLTVSNVVSGTGNLMLHNNSAVPGGITVSGPAVTNAGQIINAGTGTGHTLISAMIGTAVTAVIQSSATSPLVLSGANAYTGGTIVAAGRLRVSNTSGSATGNGAVNVNSGATLQGNGTIHGIVSNNTGGSVAPGVDGAAGATLTMSNLVWKGGGIYRCKIASLANGGAGAGIDYDLVAVSGTLTGLPGGSNLVLRLDSLGQTLAFDTNLNCNLKVLSYGALSGLELSDITLDTTDFLAGGTWTLTNVNKALYVVSMGTTADKNYWIGAGNWSASSNWSKGHAPLPGEDVEFDFRNPANCTADVVTNDLGSLTLAAGYTGTVTVLTRYPGQGLFTDMSIAGDCVINGGTLTQLANTGDSNETDRLALTIGGNLTVGPYGTLSVDQKGYNAGRGPSAGGTTSSATGAGHGGLASFGPGQIPPGPTYGSVYAPTNLGSGANGRGGGAILLTVTGTATLDGLLSARGSTPAYAGAAGGSILIRCAALAGNGVVDVSGASGASNVGGSSTVTGSGGGGRIAVILAEGATFANVSFRAFGGSGGNYPAAAGTIYLQPAGQTTGTGTLIVDNNNFTTFNTVGACTLINDVNLNALSNLVIRNRGILGINTNTTIDFSQVRLQVSGVSAVTNWRTVAATPPPSAIALRGTNLVTFPNPFVISNYCLCLDVPVSATGDWVVADNGSLSHSGNYDPLPGLEDYRLRLTLSGNLAVLTGGAIEANTKGYFYWKGPSPAATTTGQGQRGASHAGRGGPSGNNPFPLDGYGAVLMPRTLGSGGGRYAPAYTPRFGSGSIELNIQGTTTVYGIISARNNQFSEYRCAGAAGGSIFLKTGSLQGSGSIDARGDTGNENCSAGGGGRVAVVLTASESFGGVSVSAAGVTGGANPSGPGSVYLERPSQGAGKGTVVFDNAGITITSTNATQLPAPAYAPGDELRRATLVISNRAQVSLTGNLAMKDIYLYTNSVLHLNGYTLQLNTVYHTNWGNTNWVVYSNGQILWQKPGALLQFR